MASMPAAQVQFLINHLFLPPNLPQKDDQNTGLDKALLELVVKTLGRFAVLVPPDRVTTVTRLQHAIQSLVQSLDAGGGLDKQQLLRQLQTVNGRTHAMLPIYVAAQNACLLVSQVDDDDEEVVVEAFELAPRNKDVMSAQGRLRRIFPGPAVRIPRDQFDDLALLQTLAATLATMSTQEVKSMQPTVKKSKNMVQENRDTTDPALVTELLFAFLSPISLDDAATKTATTRIQKSTREDVLWSNTFQPWRRSPLWLLVRVVLQLGFQRSGPVDSAANSHKPRTDGFADGGYKMFMVFLLGTVLDKVLPLHQPSATYAVMSAKIGRRLTKMQLAGTEGAALSFVQGVLRATSDRLETIWLARQCEDQADFSLHPLRDLRFDQDVVLALPDLDGFLDEVRAAQSGGGAARVVSPESYLLSFPADVLPDFGNPPTVADFKAYNLQALERWVAQHLPAWIESHRLTPKTCQQLQDLMRSYHMAAEAPYKDNPEGWSLMLLTLLELWIAMDRSATKKFPLLADYDPGMPLRLFEQLVLPRRDDMARLHRAEVYLQTRQSRVSLGTPGSIFRDFGTSSCFAVRYVAQSSKHQTLQGTIERLATEARQKKVAELRRDRETYHNYTQQARALDCDCEKCRLNNLASNMSIIVHEWPLPSDSLDAQNVVFELAAPTELVSWRDATLWLLLGPLGGHYQKKNLPATENSLGKYRALQPHHTNHDDGRRVHLLSGAKSHMATHRKSIAVSTAHENVVCLKNGLTLRYHDASLGCFTDAVVHGDTVLRKCTYQLPALSQAALTPFLQRTFDITTAKDATANMVLTSQSSCPVHLALAEYRALAALLVGHRLPWMNLLVQLAAPAIDFKKVEATLIVLQGIYQVGPRAADAAAKATTALYRDAHSIFADGSGFAAVVLVKVRQAAARTEQNWESLQALHVFVLVVQRVLSLLLPEDTSSAEDALRLLADLRHTAFGWVVLLEDKGHQTADAAQKQFFAQRAVDAALTCASTFDVDDTYLAAVIGEGRNAVILVRCAILIHDKDRRAGADAAVADPESAPHLDGIVRWRWQRLAHRLYPLLRDQTIAGSSATKTTCLDKVVRDTWPGYRPGVGGWRMLSASLDYWVTTETQPLGEETTAASAVIHYCLLTGELLVNGLPLSRLPSAYEQDCLYRTLFGETIFQIFPSAVPGHQFTAKEPFAGYALHFNRGESARSDLLVRADKIEGGGGPWHLVPPRVFEGRLPHSLVVGCVHWYDAATGSVAFREKTQVWSDTETTWFLGRNGGNDKDGWQLAKDGAKLVCPDRQTGKALAALLAPLQPAQHINIVLDTAGRGVDIDLPRLHVSFRLEQGSVAVRSRQCKGFAVDARQTLGTLVGLCNKLVLRRESTGDDDADADRVVLVPPGPVSFSRTADHMSVSVNTSAHLAPGKTSMHIFRVNGVLGRLDHNGSMRSHLTLAYLHALTASSAGLPDPFTQRSGTEQALVILRSAAVASSRMLTADDIAQLTDLLSLVPRPVFYPPDLMVMQTIKWNAQLWPLAQHPAFYNAVAVLFAQHERTRLYFPGDDFAQPPDVASKIPCSQLLRRLAGRTATYRTAGFGAEVASTAADDTEYAARDVGQESDRCTRARTAASMLVDRQLYMATAMTSCSLVDTVWGTFKKHGTAQGPDERIGGGWDALAYDGQWLQSHAAHWAQLWCWLHGQTQQAQGCRQHQVLLRMWLATMAFDDDTDMDMVWAMAAVLTTPAMQTIDPPDVASFATSCGLHVDQSVLRSVVAAHRRPFHECPERYLPAFTDEDEDETAERRQVLFQSAAILAVNTLVDHFSRQWPCAMPTLPTGPELDSAETYINVTDAAPRVWSVFQTRFDNRRLYLYLGELEAIFRQLPVKVLGPGLMDRGTSDLLPAYEQPKSSIEPDDLFAVLPPPGLPPSAPTLVIPPDAFSRRGMMTENNEEVSPSHNPQLDELVNRLHQTAGSAYEQDYARDLSESLRQLRMETMEDHGDSGSVVVSDEAGLRQCLKMHRVACEEHVASLFAQIRDCVHAGLGPLAAARLHQHQGPRLSNAFLVQQLSHTRWPQLSDAWRPWVVVFGLALTAMQRARRLVRHLGQPSSSVRAVRVHDLLRELQNEGHANWDPFREPDTLIMEIEGELLVRPVQARIAQQMREPGRELEEESENAVLQLNMGEGKSSVIAPAVVAALADGTRLVRVIVAKPQSQQMHHMLVTRLGGLVDRPVFHLPFSRALRLSAADTTAIYDACVRCQRAGGVLLVQPEHLASLQLMGEECQVSGKDSIAAGLLRTLHYFHTTSRDIVDESDENFSVRFELVYTMGQQRAVAFAPARWTSIQAVLDVVRRHIAAVRAAHPQSVEVDDAGHHAGRFPRLRIFDQTAMNLLLQKTARDICDGTATLPGLPVVHQSPAAREAVFRYITEAQLRPEDVAALESGPFWNPASRSYVLLLRGLFARGILFFVFGQKRWRVHYGIDTTRQPPTKLAVPFRAKDSPSPRSEFSHPDVIIALTCASYYYQGLADDDLFLAFDHLINTDQADAEYHAWVQGADGLAPAFRTLMGVNLKDRVQCTTDVFPAFRYTKRAIDFFLQTIVFSRQMREFPQKLSASGWDLGAAKVHPTTGFSGTIDARRLLPLDVHYRDLPEQKHTNALVLGHLLRPENGVLPLPGGGAGADAGETGRSIAETLVRLVVDQDDSRLRVILDVGAQILEWTNAQVAAAWLRLERARPTTLLTITATPVEAAVFFDDEELVVLDYRGRTESLRTSPYSDQLDACVVFLDEAHTRGTDLRLPGDYRAAVTLGANLTKDRLVQACMRMRGLGRGQSVVFCIPEEIRIKIRTNTVATPTISSESNPDAIRVLDVLHWAIRETHHDLRKSIPLWAVQGQRFERQRLLWEAARDATGIHLSAAEAEAFLEGEAQTLEALYRPRQDGVDGGSHQTDGVADIGVSPRLAQIQARWREVADDVDASEAALHEEQERELSPEFEQERHVQRPAPALPAMHQLHPDLVQMVRQGLPLKTWSAACMPAFNALRTTSAARLLGSDSDGDLIASFPRDLLVTADFAATVAVPPAEKDASESDVYQRPVQWLLATHTQDKGNRRRWTRLIVISPFEANKLLPMIRSSRALLETPALHLYTPRPNLAVESLAHLDMYTVWPVSAISSTPLPLPPQRLTTLLNLFAGQLYFDASAAYHDLCALLRLSDCPAGATAPGTVVAADGFLLRAPAGSAAAAVIADSPFRQSAVIFLKHFLLRVRRDGQAIDKTHLGRVVNGQLLADSDFEGGDEGDDMEPMSGQSE